MTRVSSEGDLTLNTLEDTIRFCGQSPLILAVDFSFPSAGEEDGTESDGQEEVEAIQDQMEELREEKKALEDAFEKARKKTKTATR